MEVYREKIKELTDKEFQKLAAAVEVQNTKKFLNLTEQVSFYWTKINDRTYDFDSKKKLPRLIKGIKKQEVIDLYEEIFFKRRKVVEFHVISEAHSEENSKLQQERKDKVNMYFSDPGEFKAKMGFHEDYLY